MRLLIIGTAAGVLAAGLVSGLVAGAPGVAAAATTACPASSRAGAVNTWLAGSIASRSEVDWLRFSTSSSHYTAITLGHLSGNLSLTVYDGQCRKVGGADHPGRRYERVYRTLAAGRTYVRVASSNGGTGRYSLAVQPFSSGMRFVDSYASEPGQYLHITGEVVNDTGQTRSFVQVSATLYDSAGHALRSDLVFTTLSTLRQHEVSPFDVGDVRPAGYDHYRLSVRSQAASTAPVGRLTIHPQASFGDGGFRHYPGTVANGNGYPVRYVDVVQSVHNAYGTVIAVNAANTDPTSIGAGRSASYDIYAAVPANANGMTYAVQAQR